MATTDDERRQRGPLWAAVVDLTAEVVARRQQMEAEKTRLIVLAALAGAMGTGALSAALDGRWGLVVVDAVILVVCGWLFEWRWEHAMRVPGSDKANNG
jgi:hypothetical protein